MSEMQRNYYKVTLCHSEWTDDERTGWLALSSEDVQKIRRFVDNQRKLFLDRCPADAEDQDLWEEWMEDAFSASSEFIVNVGRIDPAILIGIDFDSLCQAVPANEWIINP